MPAIRIGSNPEDHFSIRDIYTNNEGSLCVRLENSRVRAHIHFPQEELRSLIEGMKDNQRLKPLSRSDGRG